MPNRLRLVFTRPRAVAARLWPRDARGVTIVEFAIIAMPFMALLIAVLQVTTAALAQQLLETAGDKAVRQLLTGQAQNAGMTKDQFRNLVCSKLSGPLKCARVYVDVRKVASFDDASLQANGLSVASDGTVQDTTKFEPGTSGDIVIARVMYLWDTQRGPLAFDISNIAGSRRLLSATSVFKTEPY